VSALALRAVIGCAGAEIVRETVCDVHSKPAAFLDDTLSRSRCDAEGSAAALRKQMDRDGHGEAALVRVFLTDLNLPIFSGAGRAMSQRSLIEMHNEADIVIDAKTPLLRVVHSWLENSRVNEDGNANTKTCVFDTRNQMYFATMKTVLAENGWKIVDRPPPKAKAKGYADGANNTPFIVYEASTADTVHQVRQLVKGGLPPTRVCALLDGWEGVAELQALSHELSAETGKEVDLGYVCSSAVYDDLFKEVRVRVRKGESCSNIQAFLDEHHNSM